MTPVCATFAMKLAKLVRDGKCGSTFTVDVEMLYLPNGEIHTILRSDEASVTPLLNGLKPRQMLDVLDELVEAALLWKRQPNRYAVTSKLFEAIL